MSENKYIEDVLIKLRRKYSKDEYVSILLNKISYLEVELGKSNSYIQELEEEKHLKSLKNGGLEWYGKYLKIKEKYDKIQLELKNNEVIKNLQNEVKRLNIKLRKK